MIRVLFDPEKLDGARRAEWDAWQKRAEDATAKVVEAFETWLSGDRNETFRFKFNSEIWKDFKDWLMLYVFGKRCAYCERPISGYYGDAEHYRPKGAVKHAGEDGVLCEPACTLNHPADNQVVMLGHPGYFWLAYDWRNLIPSCVYCNSGSGKNERFDIDRGSEYVILVKLTQAEYDACPAATRPRPSTRWPGYYYLPPSELDRREHPLLLFPLNADDDRNPRKHIRFGVRGAVAAVKKSPLGQHTIEVFRLKKDEELRQLRQEAQERFQSDYYDALRFIDTDDPGNSKAQALLNEFARGRRPFGAAVLDYYQILYERQPKPPAI